MAARYSVPSKTVWLKKHSAAELSTVIAGDGMTNFGIVKLKVNRAEVSFVDEEMYVNDLSVKVIPNGSLVVLMDRLAGAP